MSSLQPVLTDAESCDLQIQRDLEDPFSIVFCSPIVQYKQPIGSNCHGRIRESIPGICFDIEEIPEGLYAYDLRQSDDGDRFVSIESKVGANHGGTVLIDQPKGGGTRITISISIRNIEGNTLRNDVYSVDYAGEHDHALLELSDVLPAELYI